MDIQISRESGVSLRLQVGRQIAFLIANGKLKAGESLPSVRALATRLKIHHNTISQAYQDLSDFHLVERRRGSRLVVLHSEGRIARGNSVDLDDIINSAIETAQKNGYTLQQLRQKVQERLLAQAPDHVLVVMDEPGMRELIRFELEERLGCTVAACATQELAGNPALAVGALVVGPHRNIQECLPILPKDRPPHPTKFNIADEQVARVRALREPSVIAVVSISKLFLETARGVFAPALGDRHTWREFYLPEEKPTVLRSFSIVYCDSVAYRAVKAKHAIRYRLVSEETLEYLTRALGSE